MSTLNNKVISSHRIYIFIAFAILGLMVFALVLRQRTIINQFSDEYVWQLNTSIQQTTRDYLQPAQMVAKLASEMYSKKTLSFQNTESFESYAAAVSAQYPQFSAVYVGTNNDDFWFWLNGGDDSYQYAIRKILNNENKSRTESWQYFNSMNEEIDRVVNERPEFYPTQRPWFQGAYSANDNFWTEVYVFATLGVAGVTAAYPIRGEDGSIQGAWGVDIILEDLSEFLADLATARSAELVIINSVKDVVAYSGEWEINTDISLPKLTEVASPQVQQALSSYEKHGFSEFFLNFDNERYLVSVSPLSFEGVQDWSIVIVIPDNALLTQLENHVFLVLVFVSVIIAGSVFLILNQLGFTWFRNKLSVESNS